jgi:hypothetical protein
MPALDAEPTSRAARRARVHLGRTLAALVGLLACRDAAELRVPPLPPASDGGASDASQLPDGAIACAEDRDCDDGIECTRDKCLPGRYCVSAANFSACADGVFCNGDEICDPAMGCRPGVPRRCDDENVCTIDHCDEARKTCAHGARDFDDDGEADWHCPGGTDCDDFDATRGGEVAEICEDGIDNDCDDRVDEMERCGRPAHDTCEDALDVGGGGTFVVDLAGAAPDYALSCDKAGPRDVAFAFTLAKARDVTLVARGLLAGGDEETATIAVRRDCDETDSEVDCSRGFPGQIRIRALAAGTYFVIVQSESSNRVILDASFDPPTPAPTNTTCATALDVSDGGRFESDFVDVSDDLTIRCGFTDSPDLVYTFTTGKERDVALLAVSETGEQLSYALRTVCEDDTTTLASGSDAPLQGRLHRLPAGTYYVILEGPASREVDFSLDVAFAAPTDAPPGDGCAQAIPIAFGETVTGSLAERQDRVPVGCGCDLATTGCDLCRRDVVYGLHVETASDLGIVLDGGEATMAFDLRSACELPATQLSCASRYPLSARVRNVKPGDYFLIVEASKVTAFSLVVESLPLTVPEPVSGNDTCASAIDVAEGGGVFSGDTLTMLDDYQAACGGRARSHDAVFRLVLDQAAHVTAAVEAAFDSVLYRYRDEGAGPASCEPLAEAACNDDASTGDTNSFLDEMLEAGTYYYVVDGFNETSAGAYILEITAE